MSSAQQLIEAAYARSTANNPGKLATDGELLPHLNRIYQARYAIMATAAPDRASTRTTVTLAGSPPSATLPTDSIDIRRVQTAAGTKVNIIPLEELERTWHLAPAVYRQGNSIISRGGAGDPIAAEVLTLFHLDAPAALSALASATDGRYPVRFEQLLVDELALYLDSKDPNRNAAAHEKLRKAFEAGETAFLAVNGLGSSAKQSPHASP